jgi:hypothetical protein
MNVIVQVEQAELTAWPIAPGAVLIVGRAWQLVPEGGIARFERRADERGSFRAVSWSLEDNTGSSGFVAAIRLPPTTSLAGGNALALEAPNGLRITLRLPTDMTGARDFAIAATQLAEQQGGAGVRIARFLLDMFPPSVLLRLPSIGAMLATLFAGLAADDGCIELMGAIQGVCGFLQGWGSPVAQDAHARNVGVEALLVGDSVVRCRLRVATFARPDIVAPSTGMVLVTCDLRGAGAPGDSKGAAAPGDTRGASAPGDVRNAPALGEPSAAAIVAAFSGLQHVYLVTEHALLRRIVVENRVLSPADSSGHIRDILPSLSCPPAAADCLRQALRPRFEGRDTLSEHALPVRAAVDQALRVLPAKTVVGAALLGGIYLTGWLYDPTGLVSDVTLRDRTGFAVRLDTSWTRVERADVTEGLTRDGLPHPKPTDTANAHGFAVYAEGPGAVEGALYLDISFCDGTCAFLPVNAVSGRDAAARRSVLEGTDLHKPSGIAVVERQLAPFFLALMRRPPNPATGCAADPPNSKPATTISVALVVALVGPPNLPRSLLSQFLHDPLSADETLLLICGAAWNEVALDRLRGLIAFMGLNARLLHAPEAMDATAALDMAADALVARYYLLLDPLTAGCEPGWRRTLRRAVEAESAPSVVCPTLVYEDFSVRYAGAKAVTPQPAAPYVSIVRCLAGMPAAQIQDGPAQRTLLGSLVCCLVPRAVLALVGGARTHLATPFGQETAFFLRLNSAGIACLWEPRARVYAPDTAAMAEPGALVGRLVDGWCLRAAQEGNLFATK